MDINTLKDKYLLGIMNSDDGVLIYIKDENKTTTIRASSENDDGMYSWYDNWIFEKIDYVERDGEYKAIGENIESIWFEGDIEPDGRIKANMELWIKAVGKGDWGAKDGAEYWFIIIKTKTKIIRFGTTYCDCHYPSTMWDIE